MTVLIQQGSAVINLTFLMVDSSDHITGKTGLSPTVTISKNGGAYASPSGAVTEIGNGKYKIAANATDSNTLGLISIHATAAGADPCDDDSHFVVAFNPLDAVRLGLTSIPNVSQGSAGALPTADATGKVLFQVGTEAGKLDTVSGAVKLASNQDVRTVTGNVTGSVGSISGVTFPTNFGSLSIDASGIAQADVEQIQGFATAATVLSNILTYYGINETLPPVAKSAATLDWSADVTNKPTIGTSTLTAQQVWEYATRTLSAFGFSVTVGTNSDKTGYSLTATPPTAQQIWEYATRTLTSAGSGGATAQEVWEYATRSLTDKAGFALTADYDPAKSAATASNLAAVAGYIDTEMASVLAIVGHATYGNAALKTAIDGVSSGTAPSASEVAAAVVDQTLSGHTTSGTVGGALNAAGSSGDPWSGTIPGEYAEGTAGYIVGMMVPAILADTATLEAGGAVVRTARPVAGTLELYQGETYSTGFSNRIAFPVSDNWPSLPVGGKYVLEITVGSVAISADGTVDGTDVVFSLTHAQTAFGAVSAGTRRKPNAGSYAFGMQNADGTDIHTLESGTVHVLWGVGS